MAKKGSRGGDFPDNPPSNGFIISTSDAFTTRPCRSASKVSAGSLGIAVVGSTGGGCLVVV